MLASVCSAPDRGGGSRGVILRELARYTTGSVQAARAPVGLQLRGRGRGSVHAGLRRVSPRSVRVTLAELGFGIHYQTKPRTRARAAPSDLEQAGHCSAGLRQATAAVDAFFSLRGSKPKNHAAVRRLGVAHGTSRPADPFQ